MGKYLLKLPKMGESIAEATITKWLKEVGDIVEVDESIVEIATDKVDSDVPSEFKGKLIKKNFEVNDIVKVGDTIAEIETDSIENDDEVIDNSPKKQEDIIIIRTYDEPLGLSPKLRFAMTDEEYQNFVKLIGQHGEFVDIIDIILRGKEAEQVDKMAEEHNQ